MLEIFQLPLGPIQTNCYIAICQATQQTAVIDPSDQADVIQRVLTEQNCTLSHILLTHAHFDHVGALGELKAAFPEVPVSIHPDAVAMLAAAPRQAAMFGLQMMPPPPPDVMLAEGDIIQVGEVKLDVLYTPGHAPGHVAFHAAKQKVVFSGDVLFQGSIGRTDLPGGDFDLLINVIRTQLLTLPDETQVLSGHGPATTIGVERAMNPFLR